MRKQLLSVFLPLLAFVIVAAAETPGTGATVTGRSALEKVNVTRTADGFNVELMARGAVAPKLTTLDSPARLVLDLPNTVPATARGHINVGPGEVKDVRIGMDGQIRRPRAWLSICFTLATTNSARQKAIASS